MFRPLMVAISRLYMDLSSTYTTDTTYVGCFLGVGKGSVWDRDLLCVSGGCMIWNSIISLFMPYFYLRLAWDSTTANKYSCVLTIYTHNTMVLLLL